jgi:hypothetical protein
MKNKYFILGLVFSVFLFSCSKELDTIERLDVEEVMKVAKDAGWVDQLYNDAGEQTDEAFMSKDEENYGTKKSELINYGPTITVSPGEDGTYADTAYIITIDFGTGITSLNGWVRKGKIIVDVEGRFMKQGSKRTISYDNYYVNNNKLEGIHTVVNRGYSDLESAYLYDIEVVSGVVTKSDGGVIEYSSKRQRKWTSGYETLLDWTDDVYLISGTYEGISSDQVPYNAEITSDIQIFTNCRYVQEGVVLYNIGDNPDIIIDYGYGNDGSCDDNASLTINGYTYPYTMLGW